MVRGNRLFKRRELRNGDQAPVGFEEVDYDDQTKAAKKIGLKLRQYGSLERGESKISKTITILVKMIGHGNE